MDTVIAEARAQFDRQRTDLSELRSRALGMAAIGMTEVGLLAATAKPFMDAGGWLLYFWCACFLVVVFGLLGMASIASTSAEFHDVVVSDLWGRGADVREFYASELADSLPLGYSTLNARRTVFRHALALMVLGALAYGILWSLSF